MSSSKASLGRSWQARRTQVDYGPGFLEKVFRTFYRGPADILALLVKDALARSCTVITGVEMFIRQAALQFKLFTGQEAPSDLMRDVLRRAIGPARY